MNNQTETLNIVGGAADKIKNNVKTQVQQFSWKLSFPKEVVVNEIPTEGIVILNKNLKRMRTEFVVYPNENSISISPQTPYKPGQEYFFWAKYRRKEICISFLISKDNEMQTFDQKTSIEKLNARFKRETRKADFAKEQQEKERRDLEARAVKKANAAKQVQVFDDDDDD